MGRGINDLWKMVDMGGINHLDSADGVSLLGI